MRRKAFQLGTALITFSLGVGAAWLVLLISQPNAVEIKSPPSSETITHPPPETLSVASSKPATVVFSRLYKNKYRLILAEFKVTNISNKPLYYAGAYSNPNWNRYYSVRRGSELEESDRTCGTGMAGHALSRGETATFEVVVGEEPGVVQVGFDFFAGEERLEQTIWSDEVYVSE